MRLGESWYQGTADAIFQNMNLIDDFRPDLVAVFGADHIYRMDIAQMIDFHVERKSAITVATLPVPVTESDQFGILDVDSGLRVTGFDEKPRTTRPMPGSRDQCLASMGNYLFDPTVLRAALIEDSQNHSSHHDFGRDLSCADRARTGVRLQFHDEPDPRRFGRELQLLARRRDDRGYHEANMDLRDARPHLNLYNPFWPLRSSYYNQPPAKFVFNEESPPGQALHSVISEGCIISGGSIRNSVLGRSVFFIYIARSTIP